jgi:glycosyltransferase involved in cell wall biosynthesis
MGIPKHPLNRKADYVIAISRELQDYLIKSYNYAENQVKLIFNGVSEKKFAISNNQSSESKILFNIPSDRVVFGAVGSVSFRKGIDVLIKAIARCKHLKIHLIVLGDGEISWLNELIEDNGISEMVTIIPFRDPKEIYNAMDVLILPSRKEGFPLVPIEAMMMKKPVIRSNVEGAYDQIIDGFNGYIFDSENDVQLAAIIEKMSLNPEILPVLGENAYNHAITNFTEDTMVDKLLDVYKLTQ